MTVHEQELSHPDEVLETRSEDRVAFTQIGDWVLLADITPTAKALYALLAAHVNVEDEHRRVWPSKETLAGWLKLKQARSVGKYLDELLAIGAITKTRQDTSQGMRTRNIYGVRWNPPVGLPTPDSFGEFYRERNRQRRSAGTAGQDVVRSDAPRAEQEEDGYDGSESETAGQSVVRSGAPRSAVERGDVVRPSAPEQDQSSNKINGGDARGETDRPVGEPGPDRNAPSPMKPQPGRRETWKCDRHLADPDPQDRPCRACADVRRTCESRQAELDRAAAAAAEEATAGDARRARDCGWCDGRHVLADGVPVEPLVRCDHETTTPERAVELARAERERREAERAPRSSDAGRARARELFRPPAKSAGADAPQATAARMSA